MAEDAQVLIEPVEDAALVGEGAREMIVRHPQIVELLGDPDPGKLVVGGPDLLGRKRDEHSRFRATVFDPTTNRAVEVVGPIDAPERGPGAAERLAPDPAAG
jgi:hypothetical protein